MPLEPAYRDVVFAWFDSILHARGHRVRRSTKTLPRATPSPSSPCPTLPPSLLLSPRTTILPHPITLLPSSPRYPHINRPTTLPYPQKLTAPFFEEIICKTDPARITRDGAFLRVCSICVVQWLNF